MLNLDTISNEEFIKLDADNSVGGLAKLFNTSQYKINKRRKDLGLMKERISRLAFPQQYERDRKDEEWRPGISHLGEVENTLVSNYGNVIGPSGKELQWVDRGGYPAVSLLIDKTVAGYDYDASTKWEKKRVSASVHVLVANTFLRLEDNLPEQFKEEVLVDGKIYRQWDLFSDNFKAYVRSLLIVDHIDGDKANPYVGNLRYVSPRENNVHVKRSNESSN